MLTAATLTPSHLDPHHRHRQPGGRLAQGRSAVLRKHIPSQASLISSSGYSQLKQNEIAARRSFLRRRMAERRRAIKKKHALPAPVSTDHMTPFPSDEQLWRVALARIEQIEGVAWPLGNAARAHYEYASLSISLLSHIIPFPPYDVSPFLYSYAMRSNLLLICTPWHQ